MSDDEDAALEIEEKDQFRVRIKGEPICEDDICEVLRNAKTTRMKVGPMRGLNFNSSDMK